MIKSFRHKRLKEFFTMGGTKGIRAAQAKRLRATWHCLDFGFIHSRET